MEVKRMTIKYYSRKVVSWTTRQAWSNKLRLVLFDMNDLPH